MSFPMTGVPGTGMVVALGLVTATLAAFPFSGLWKRWFCVVTADRFWIGTSLFLCALIILGTLIPQGLPESALARRYGRLAAEVLIFLGAKDLFQTPFFIVTLALWGLGALVKTLETLRLWRKVLGHHWDGWLSHLGVIVVLAGCFFSAVGSFRGLMDLSAGAEKSSVVPLSGPGRLAGEGVDSRAAFSAPFRALPFSLLLDAFEVRYQSADGLSGPGEPQGSAQAPKVREYVSVVHILDPGRQARLGPFRISVNHPLRYRGYWIHQFSWNPADETRTRLQIVYDPGWPVVLVGMGFLAAGAVAAGFRRTWAVIGQSAAFRRRTFERMLLLFMGAIPAVVLALRWQTTHRPPFQGLSDTLMLFAACLGISLAGLGRYVDIRAVARPAVLCVGLLAAWALALSGTGPEALPPALQSIWFIPHVLLYFMGYAFLAVSALCSGACLVSDWRGKERTPGLLLLNRAALTAGFACLTLGLLIGALWAKYAWAGYWGWDPKESWALITWLLYLILFHLSLYRPIPGRWTLVAHIVVFGVVLFTYLGISFLPTALSGIHAY